MFSIAAVNILQKAIIIKKGGCESHSRPKTKHEKKLSVYDFYTAVDEFVEGFAFQEAVA